MAHARAMSSVGSVLLRELACHKQSQHRHKRKAQQS
ncbi:uncharacterized protein FTOL_07087 [Fusarium torulosum]|uniref:Uncharacterized protein n=1 Tax=Fusarium torulosum TaxID=33205 RepID=A0AAE8SJD4_9HYPO|nr:uncharacterized protein FTOL_07087 [Fusarium torulosum]